MLIYISHFGNYYIVLRVVKKILLRRLRPSFSIGETRRFVPNEDKYENIDYGSRTVSCLTERIYYFHIFETRSFSSSTPGTHR